MNELFTQLSYLTAATLFVFSLRWLNRPKTARRGVLAGVVGMVLAVVASAKIATCLTVSMPRSASRSRSGSSMSNG